MHRYCPVLDKINLNLLFLCLPTFSLIGWVLRNYLRFLGGRYPSRKVKQMGAKCGTTGNVL